MKNSATTKPEGRLSDKRVPAADGGISMSDRAYGIIEELIVMLELEPGQMISESMLVEQFGIGRTPVREALQRLAREGLVNILPRRGMQVSTINVEEHLELLRTRRAVESLMAELACERATDEEIREFRRIAEGLEQAARDDDETAFVRLDQELNNLLAHSARNQFADKAMQLMQGLSRRFWCYQAKYIADLPPCARLHARQARAISRRQSDAAVAATEALLDHIAALPTGLRKDRRSRVQTRRDESSHQTVRNVRPAARRGT